LTVQRLIIVESSKSSDRSLDVFTHLHSQAVYVCLGLGVMLDVETTNVMSERKARARYSPEWQRQGTFQEP
jgi:hypothetical protein